MAKTKKRKAPKRRKSSTKKKSNNKKKSMWGKITTAVATVAGLDNIAGHDMADSAGEPIAARGKNFINAVVGRTTGFNPVPNTPYNYSQQVSVDGMFNKYTGIGLGLLGYAMIPARILPHKAKARQLGKSIFGGGLLGGLFSTGNPHSHNLLTNTHSTAIVQNAGVT